MKLQKRLFSLGKVFQGPDDIEELDAAEISTSPRALASTLPSLLVEAKQLSSSILAGIHGRRRAGAGQTFWQFRQYGPGDASSRIDWRRSARGDSLFVREMEWESAHTVRLSVDMSNSMRFQSPDAREAKRDRGVLMALAVADLLAKGGERVGLIGGERPKTGDAALQTIIQELLARDVDKHWKDRWADMTPVRPREDVIVVSDFLFSRQERDQLVKQLVQRAARAHFIQIIDPAEEVFPFRGRVKFEAISKKQKSLITGRAQDWSAAYKQQFKAFCDELSHVARSYGWSHTVSQTARPATLPLLSLHEALSRSRER
ncbi:MAG: DUF58 domain-containing protein [Pseudomonadota bacterium]